jgi:SAM-dependent methyltransferase
MIMNDKNLAFYENIGLDPFKELSEKGGFSSHRDLETIASYIKDDASILELGAGFGRCLEYFIQKNHKGKLTAVEFSKPLARFLEENFHEQVRIVNADIKTLALDEKYDVALWMWSGIIDFSAIEQKESCTRIFHLLNEGGQLFIDVPRLGVPTIANHLDNQRLIFTTPYGEITAYIPDDNDMEIIRKEAGFKSLTKIEYDTATDKKRSVYRLQK